MAILTILVEPDPRLREVSTPVAEVTPEVKQLIEDMKETMLAANGAGLAAPQVGHNICLFLVLQGSKKIVTFINPVFVVKQGIQRGQEGCLSIPSMRVEKPRASRVVVRALNERGVPFQVDASGFFARAIQHEYDHLLGVLMTDEET